MEIQATVKCRGETGRGDGGAQRRLRRRLTVYDMCKALQKDMVISDIRLLKKTGGKSGTFLREE